MGHRLLAKAAKVLGLDEAIGASKLAQSIDELLGPVDEGTLDLRDVFTALHAAGVAAGRPVIVFIDEIQRLTTDWSGSQDSRYVQEAMAEVMERHDGRVVLLLASEETAVEGLFAAGEPLHHDGMNYRVPPISDADWHHGLRERFAELGLGVERERLDQILQASGGHPQRTMRVCAHVHQLCNDAYAITDVLVEQAITAAREHPSWT